MENQTLQIDIKSIIRGKNPKLLPWIPGFVLRWIGKLIHERELNESLSRLGNKTGIDFIRGALDELGIFSKATGFDQIPDQGRFLFVSNHPLGGLDGMVMMEYIARKFPNVKFVVNDLLMNLNPLKDVFLPVNKHGRQSVTYARMIDQGFRSDAQILYFPAGICSRKSKGTISDLIWNPNFVKKAIHYQRDIIPVYFEGRNSDFFYRLAHWRKKMGIRFNFEMLWLVDEMFKQKGSCLKIHFGEPIPCSSLSPSVSASEWSKQIRDKVYALSPDKNQQTRC